MREAIIKDNDIHDELFEGDGSDVSVQDAVDMAGTGCRVQSIGQNFDLIGFDCQNQLQDVFESLSAPRLSHPKFKAVVTIGRTMLFIVNAHGYTMIVDSHRHGSSSIRSCYCLLCSRKIKDFSRIAGSNTSDLLAARCTILFCYTGVLYV